MINNSSLFYLIPGFPYNYVFQCFFYFAVGVVNEVMEENKYHWNKEFNITIPLPVVITSGYTWGNMS